MRTSDSPCAVGANKRSGLDVDVADSLETITEDRQFRPRSGYVKAVAVLGAPIHVRWQRSAGVAIVAALVVASLAQALAARWE